MAEEQGKEEEKFDFTGEGEAVGYISLDMAFLIARRLARQNDDFYRQRLGWPEIVWRNLAAEHTEDFYRIVLEFHRPVRDLQNEKKEKRSS